jgi:hypothetical protein
LYLFLIPVAEGDGLSHWSERSIARLLNVGTQIVLITDRNFDFQHSVKWGAGC